ncbi:MAG TPA: sugar phosphate isomerase/epimerase family protein [Bryobacteraceae bacterium]|jgi:sugar phosphate isomerase/epimerase|nr:sugar phosphate isomerase/epimerase family protein [Bryobacteraceae bacterium]
MTRALSTHLFANHRLTTIWLERIWNAGIPLVEIFCARQHLDYRDKAQIAELGHWFRDSELKLHSLHSPMYSDEFWGRSGPDTVLNIAEPERMKRIHTVDEIKRALEIAETVPFRYLIQHLGVGGEEWEQRKIDTAFSSLEEISVFARQRGVEVLLENTPNQLSSAERLLMFLEMTHLDLNVCFDLGHANMNEGVEPAFRALSSHIRSTHVHDNNGSEDSHLFPLVAEGGTIDWARAMTLLRSLGGAPSGQCPLLLELREVPEWAHPLDQVRESFERLENVKSSDES